MQRTLALAASAYLVTGVRLHAKDDAPTCEGDSLGWTNSDGEKINYYCFDDCLNGGGVMLENDDGRWCAAAPTCSEGDHLGWHNVNGERINYYCHDDCMAAGGFMTSNADGRWC